MSSIIKTLLIFAGVSISIQAFSQDKEVKDITSYPNPSIILNWSYNNWLEVPKGMEVSPLSMGFDIYGMYPLLGRNSFLSLVGGAGLSVQNIKSNAFLVNQDSSYFSPIPSGLEYNRNKITTVFVDIPLELRFRSRPTPPNKSGKVRKRNFKLALGFKLGYKVQSYIKYDGEDYRSTNYASSIKYKEYRLNNILAYRYGVYARIGYGKFSAYGYFALTDFFENKKGPELRPFAVGLTITI